MKKLVLLLLLISTLVLGSFILASCHKYPEDPFISFRRPNKRIEGTWNITKYQVWGIDHSHDFDSILAPKTLTDYCLKFSPFDNALDVAFGTYTFVDKNNNARFTSNTWQGDHYRFEDAGGISTTLYFDYFKGNSDTTFYTLFFGIKNIFTRSTSNEFGSDEWDIVELYEKKFHISKNGIDIYFKKQ